MTAAPPVQLADWCVVRTHQPVGTAIAAAEWVNDLIRRDLPSWRDFEHAALCVGFEADGTPRIVEAEPGGARVRRMHYPDADVLWSSGRTGIDLTPQQRRDIAAAGLGFEGVGYSDADYAAFTAATLAQLRPVRPVVRPLVGPLRAYVDSSGHMICSQLVDRAYLAAGVHLFADGRWPGYVSPSDLAALIRQ